MSESKEISFLYEILSHSKKEKIKSSIIEKEIRKGRSREIAELIAEALTADRVDIKAYPDIIVHKRLDLEQNLLIVEVKCSDDSRKQEGDDFDREKLKLFTTPPYNYQLGIFLKLYKNGYKIETFKAGQRVSLPAPIPKRAPPKGDQAKSQ